MDIQQDNDKQNVRTRHIDIRLTEKRVRNGCCRSSRMWNDAQ